MTTNTEDITSLSSVEVAYEPTLPNTVVPKLNKPSDHYIQTGHMVLKNEDEDGVYCVFNGKQIPEQPKDLIPKINVVGSVFEDRKLGNGKLTFSQSGIFKIRIGEHTRFGQTMMLDLNYIQNMYDEVALMKKQGREVRKVYTAQAVPVKKDGLREIIDYHLVTGMTNVQLDEKLEPTISKEMDEKKKVVNSLGEIVKMSAMYAVALLLHRGYITVDSTKATSEEGIDKVLFDDKSAAMTKLKDIFAKDTKMVELLHKMLFVPTTIDQKVMTATDLSGLTENYNITDSLENLVDMVQHLYNHHKKLIVGKALEGGNAGDLIKIEMKK